MNARTTLAVCAALSVALAGTASAVTVSVDAVVPAGPREGTVTIDYTLGFKPGEALSSLDRLVFTATDRKTGRTWMPRRFREVILPTTAGRHRVTWEANLDAASESGAPAVKADALVVTASLVSASEEYLEIDVSGGPKAASYPVTVRKGLPKEGYGAEKYKTDVIVLRRLPAGAFMAGSPDGEWGRQGFREHRHPVALTKPFYISIYPTTRRQYANVMGGTCPDGEATLPVRQLSFVQIRGGNWPASAAVRAGSVMDVLRKKCKLPGLAADFDLPTESQWEYACRAGTDTGFNDGSVVKDEASARTVLAKLGAVGVKKSEPVGSFAPNAWGIYDMHGNVYDICRDRYVPDVRRLGQTFDPAGASGGGSRVRRGGNFDSGLAYARSAARGDDPENGAMAHNGFRLVCTAADDAAARVLAKGASKPVAVDLDLDSWLAKTFPATDVVEDIVFADGDTVWIYDGTKPFTASDAARWSWRARDDKALPPDYRNAMNGFGETKPMKDGRWIGVTGGFRWAIIDVATKTAVAWGQAPGSPHTLELLGDGMLAVASTDCSHEVHLYDIAGEKARQPNKQNRTAFRKLGDHVFNYPHGLHWDAASQKLWYAGSCGTNPRNEGELCKCSVTYANGKFSMSVDKVWKTKVGGVMLSDAHDLRPVPGTSRLAVTTVEKLVYFDMKTETWVDDDVLPYGPAKSFDPSADGRRFLVQIPTSSWIAYKLRLACYPTPGKAVWIDSFKSRPGLQMYKARWIRR